MKKQTPKLDWKKIREEVTSEYALWGYCENQLFGDIEGIVKKHLKKLNETKNKS